MQENMTECGASALVSHLHTLAFYPDRTPENETIATYFLDDSLTAYVERVLIWGSLIGVVGAVILVCCCVCSCCMCGFCYGGDIKPMAVKVFLGSATTILIIITMLVLSVELWLEVQIDKDITDHATKVAYFAHNFSDSAQDIVEDMVTDIQNKKHITTIFYLCLLLGIMLLTLLSATLAPVCKSSAPLFVMLVVVSVVSFITLLLLVLTFIVIVLFSDVCIGLYDINPDLCSTDLEPDSMASSEDWTEVLNVFCNETVTYSFLFFMLGIFTTLFLVVAVMFGLTYAASLTGKKKPEMVLLSPSAILEAYEAPEHALNKYTDRHISEDAVPLMGVVDDT